MFKFIIIFLFMRLIYMIVNLEDKVILVFFFKEILVKLYIIKDFIGVGGK